VEIVAGLSLKNLKPRVWDPNSPYYLPTLRAVMVSYADIERMPARRTAAMREGLHSYLGVPGDIKIYLDNGSFYQLTKGGETSRQAYEEFVVQARPDWYAIPQDYIPTPFMSDEEQLACLRRTMEMNRSFHHNGFVPVVHISRHLENYLSEFLADARLSSKSDIALGGIVPNLLRAPKAMAYADVLHSVRQVRQELSNQRLHVFGLGGTATMHLAALLHIDSADSSGWRNRAARGIVQLPGCGDRMVTDLGSWRGRSPDQKEWEILAACGCPACQHNGIEGLRASGIDGFCNRATHNLWTLLEETRQIEEHLIQGSYETWYQGHIDNSIYRPLIDYLLSTRQNSDRPS
jgi:7-cyano-7-deazaguanine tRNA-ribosyltransferase